VADVEVTRDGAVQTITLNRPEKMNAFTRGMHRELLAALKDAPTRTCVRSSSQGPGVRSARVRT